MSDPLRREKELARCRDKAARAYKKDPEKFKQRARDRSATPEGSEYNKNYAKQYKQKYPERIQALNLKHNHKDRAERKKRLPKWVNKDELMAINRLYKEAKDKGLSVDHIIPLQGKNVSGLHVLSNLQLIPLSENCAKKNKYEVL